MNSIPVLPEDEILSNLLFGASVRDLSAFQLAELATALASFSGGGEGLNVLAGARKGLGLDNLSITSDPDKETGALIAGGKYLTRDVYLEIETATATGETITRLLYDITRRFRAESEVSQKAGSSLKIKWFWDY
jgi:translocation and assembly module TamB